MSTSETKRSAPEEDSPEHLPKVRLVTQPRFDHELRRAQQKIAVLEGEVVGLKLAERVAQGQITSLQGDLEELRKHRDELEEEITELQDAESMELQRLGNENIAISRELTQKNIEIQTLHNLLRELGHLTIVSTTVTSQPAPSQTTPSQPVPSQPAPSSPAPSQPALTSPAPSPPAPSQPAPSSPAPSPPAPSQPAPSQPAPSQPAPSQPTPSQPAPSQPAPSQPAPSQPAPSQPAPSQPAPSQPTPSQPTPSQPTLSQPTPSQPAPSQPAHQGDHVDSTHYIREDAEANKFELSQDNESAVSRLQHANKDNEELFEREASVLRNLEANTNASYRVLYPLDALPNREAQNWFHQAFNYVDVDLGPQYTDLLIKWTEFERHHLWKRANGRLATSKRPLFITEWISGGRYPPRYKGPRFEGDFVHRFSAEMREWWKLLQSWTPLNLDGGNGNWTSLNKSGINGWFSMVVGVKWWGQSLKGLQGEEQNRFTQDWIRIIGDATAALEELLRFLKGRE
ncbi:hypothetical protein K435DRAFT_793210 [Dendrothele bispora CBS 962.96]|uniref:Uncharacterized protein n=1 Tax=Dendrothele bispora (strain CBS 962.96) TaxID=1314807 RepID=A0A4S8MG16_DENBC|nr:hypothetical protein K435DRAFT_793210 [Dendrothele bispora CBS 962.96]